MNKLKEGVIKLSVKNIKEQYLALVHGVNEALT